MLCIHCNQEPVSITKSGEESKFCSLSCRSKYHAQATNEKRKLTNLQKYGVDNPSKSSDVIRRRDKTNLEKYGVTNPFSLNMSLFDLQMPLA